MIEGQKVIAVMPAYNAGDTLVKTWREIIQHESVDLVIVVDDRRNCGRSGIPFGRVFPGYTAAWERGSARIGPEGWLASAIKTNQAKKVPYVAYARSG